MQLLLVAASLVLAASAEYAPIMQDYHREYGIPAAARIKAMEEAQDFDGSRIAGGSASTVGAHPHVGGLVITLTNNQQSVCGSSLISNTRALSAAHCWVHGNSNARQLTVVLASVRLFSGGTRINTNRVTPHAGYNSRTLVNDIMVIIINHVGFTNNIGSIGLASGTNLHAGAWGVVAGFGRTGDGAQDGITNNQALRHVSVQVITNAVCARTFGSIITASNICVGTVNGQSPCAGDSGSSLVSGSGNNRISLGVVSFGHSSGCTRGHPVAFARTSSFNPWIRQQM